MNIQNWKRSRVGTLKSIYSGVLLCSRLRIWHCHCNGLGWWCGMASILGSGTSICYGHSKEEKENENEKKKVSILGVPVVAQRVTNPMRIHEDVGSTPGLTQWVKNPALPWAVVYCRRGSDPVLLWLRGRPAAVTPIRPLAWELRYAAGEALKKASILTSSK